jgi:GTP-binding protein
MPAAIEAPWQRATLCIARNSWRHWPSGDSFRRGALEVAFAGRSNAGKSSAINASPGGTDWRSSARRQGERHINFFQLDSGGLIADLPATDTLRSRSRYGFTGRIPRRYLAERVPLVGLVLLMDTRHPMAPLDRQLLDWFLPTGRPVRVLLTKADKLPAGERRRVLQDASHAFATGYGTAQIGAQLFSATERLGIADAEAAINAWIADWAPSAQKERPRHQGE